MPKRLTDRPTNHTLTGALMMLTGLEVVTRNQATNRPTYYIAGNPEDACTCQLDTWYACQMYGCAGIPGEREWVAAVEAGEFDHLADAQAEREDLLDDLGIGAGYTYEDLVWMP